MIPSYKKIHSQLKINGFSFNRERLLNMGVIYTKEGDVHMKSVGAFLLNWLDTNDYIEAYTSGSTGVPKKIRLKKQHMVNSAVATGDYLGLKPNDTALCCLPVDFIAGKMMIVRAIVLGLDLQIVTPSSMPLSLTEKHFDFCAMVSMQASKSIYSLHRIKKLLLGGGEIDSDLEEKLKDLPTQVYSSYGMTETVSHVALRKVNHTEDVSKAYHALPHVSFDTDDHNCLIIDAPYISDCKVHTRDVVELFSPTTFVWRGRMDNMINSAGFKIYPESVEAKLKSYISHPYFIGEQKDETYGSVAVLYIEANEGTYEHLLSDLHKNSEILRYEIPKKIYYVPKFVVTPTHKIQREETIKKYSENI